MHNTTIQKTIKVFLAGLCISFLGSLPLGTMNVAATHISLQQGTRAGLIYSFGSMIVEVIIVRLSLMGMDWLARRHKIFYIMEIFTVGLMLLLATASFVAAYNMTGFSNSFHINNLPPFWSGVLLSASNPLHIPFWLGWSIVLLEKKILMPQKRQYNYYVFGIGNGTILGFMVFIYGGNYFVSQIINHQNLLNCSIGIALLITAILQILKMINEPASVRYGKMLKL